MLFSLLRRSCLYDCLFVCWSRPYVDSLFIWYCAAKAVSRLHLSGPQYKTFLLTGTNVSIMCTPRPDLGGRGVTDMARLRGAGSNWYIHSRGEDTEHVPEIHKAADRPLNTVRPTTNARCCLLTQDLPFTIFTVLKELGEHRLRAMLADNWIDRHFSVFWKLFINLHDCPFIVYASLFTSNTCTGGC